MIQTIVRAAVLAAALAGGALADPILLTFTGPGSGVAGSSVTLVGSVINTSGAAQTLDGLAFTFTSPFTNYDDSPFFLNWPLSLDGAGPGSEFGPSPMFRVEIPAGTPVGLYTGNQVNLYGDGGSTLLTTQSFDIDVAANDVPEPASVGLVACGMAALAIVRRGGRGWKR